ncbi:MAG: hypothetical protein CBD35_06510 [Verrucomicrobia bacterium TMED175]|nr:MAG: hypothetical protein CBD35_06510 [Verrucomicrobia bacterium TMED175]
MNKKVLVTTAINLEKKNNDSLLYLGRWCLDKYDRKKSNNLNHTILPYHWDNREKLYNDYIYLDNFYEKILKEISYSLNKIHNTDYSIRYWRILIGPWLGYFIHIIFDRWSNINQAKKNYEISHAIIQSNKNDEVVPKNMSNFQELIRTDSWNHFIYSYILINFTNIECKYLKKNQKIKKFKNQGSIKIKIKLKKKLKIFLNFFSNFFVNDTDAFIINSYLSKKNEFLLNIKLKQIPKFYSEISKNFESKLDLYKRRWKLNGQSNNEFEILLRELVPQQIPIYYIENYNNLIKFVLNLKWPKKPKAIFTSGSYISDDIFKFYAANKTEQGSPLVIGQHGGGTGTYNFSFNEEHQIKICDLYLSWGWENIQSNKVKPIGQLKDIKKIDIDYINNDKILLVTIKIPEYSSRLVSTPISSQWVSYYEDQCKFIDYLSPKIRESLTVRLKLLDTIGLEPSYERWKNKFPSLDINNGSSNIKSLIVQSKIYVSTYNATTFLESFSYNIPTVIFWDKSMWELRDSAKKYFDHLKMSKILHDSPISAAQHINNIWNNIDDWWCSDIVKNSRKVFLNQYCKKSNDIASDVKSSLQKIIEISN